MPFSRSLVLFGYKLLTATSSVPEAGKFRVLIPTVLCGADRTLARCLPQQQRRRTSTVKGVAPIAQSSLLDVVDGARRQAPRPETAVRFPIPFPRMVQDVPLPAFLSQGHISILAQSHHEWSQRARDKMRSKPGKKSWQQLSEKKRMWYQQEERRSIRLMVGNLFVSR